MSRGKLSYGKDGEPVLELSDGRRIGSTERGSLSGNGVVLLIDRSGSMEGDKIRQAAAGAIDYAKAAFNLKGVAVGVVTFQSSADLLVETTTRLEAIIQAVENISTTGGTNMAEGLMLANVTLGDHSPRTIVLVSDGAPDSKDKAFEAAREARLRHIRIICIGVDGADLDFLRLIASAPSLATKVGVGNGGLQKAIAASVNRLLLKG